jgi:hypothetical protein
MSDSMHPKNHTPDPRAEALAWLAGQFRWESLLADLHELSERETAPVVDLDQAAEPRAPRPAQNEEDAA